MSRTLALQEPESVTLEQIERACEQLLDPGPACGPEAIQALIEADMPPPEPALAAPPRLREGRWLRSPVRFTLYGAEVVEYTCPECGMSDYALARGGTPRCRC
jgi:hypothetical protein